MDAKRTAWILGSGFSRSLGGPLLNELLTPTSQDKARARFPKLPHYTEPYRLFAQHNPNFPRIPGMDMPELWTNAEDFLSFMDALRTDGFRSRLFAPHHPEYNPDDLYRKCVQAVALEVLFTDDDSDLDAEHWRPYVDWAKSLTENDTIITFNYDLVLERLAAKNLGSLMPDSILMPDQGRSQKTAVYKLHGSIDWTFEGNADRPIRASLQDTIDRKLIPLIATPGPTKNKHAEGYLAGLWKSALDAIRLADAVVFMGYRFPPSDSEARRRILGAIRENKQRLLTVQTVLGPRVHDDDTVRLAALLEAVLGSVRVPSSRPAQGTRKALRYEVKVNPLLAQDFLTVVHPDMLHMEDHWKPL